MLIYSAIVHDGLVFQVIFHELLFLIHKGRWLVMERIEILRPTENSVHWSKISE